MKPRTVVVVHPEAMVAEGIAAALGAFPWIVPIAATTSVAEAEARARGADAVALDHSLEGAEAAAARLRRNGARVVFLGETEVDGDDVRVSTQESVGALAAALVPSMGNGHSSPSALTLRERQVLRLAARGFAGKQIARHLGISPKTVEVHKTRMYAKLGVPNQAAAVRAAFVNEQGRSRP
jgi:DNA-binding CsgD family transcriptional regulator